MKFPPDPRNLSDEDLAEALSDGERILPSLPARIVAEPQRRVIYVPDDTYFDRNGMPLTPNLRPVYDEPAANRTEAGPAGHAQPGVDNEATVGGDSAEPTS